MKFKNAVTLNVATTCILCTAESSDMNEIHRDPGLKCNVQVYAYCWPCRICVYTSVCVLINPSIRLNKECKCIKLYMLLTSYVPIMPTMHAFYTCVCLCACKQRMACEVIFPLNLFQGSLYPNYH